MKATVLDGESPWRLSWRADPVVARLADGHYSRQKPGTPQFVPPGSCLVLKTPDGQAGWVTSAPKAEYVKHAWAGAWVNSLFVRKPGSPHRASNLIHWGVAHTRWKWPDVPELGIITMIDPAEVEDKETPGWCYLMAGWRFVGYTQGGLHVYQQLPGRAGRTRGARRRMPPAEPVPGSQASLFDLKAA